MTDYVNPAARWGAPPTHNYTPGFTNYAAPSTDRMAYANPGPPPWSTDWSTATEQAAPQPPPKKGVPTWVKVLAVFAGLAMVSLCGGLMIAGLSGAGEPKPGFTTMPVQGAESPAAPDATKGPVTVKLGKTFRSGDFEYTVRGVKTGIGSVGDQYLAEKAQGSFTRLDVTIKNVSERPLYFDTDLRVKVQDAKGRQFSTSSEANVLGNKDQNGFFTEINPGNQIRAFAYFDLPKNTKATKVVVSAGLFTFEADAVVPLS